MCGIEIRSFSTKDPSLVDCKKCKGAYVCNVEWYLEKMAGTIGPAARWADIDDPMFFVVALHSWPRVPFSWGPVVKQWEIDYRLREG